jgi:cytochrome c oxidase assembly protein subunit 15
MIMLVTLIIQISWGGFMAGLKAGHVSNTFPLMNGRLIPPGFLTQLEPWWYNFVAGTQAVHFIHRWFAFIVLAASIILYVVAKKRAYSPQVQKGLVWMWVLTALQVTLGVMVVWFQVPLILALSHQALALGLFIVAIYLNYRVAHERVPYTGALEPRMELTAA